VPAGETAQGLGDLRHRLIADKRSEPAWKSVGGRDAGRKQHQHQLGEKQQLAGRLDGAGPGAEGIRAEADCHRERQHDEHEQDRIADPAGHPEAECHGDRGPGDERNHCADQAVEHSSRQWHHSWDRQGS
jgi:hypothetical protein